VNDTQDEDMPNEIDFSQSVRGKFYRSGMKLNLPVYLDEELQIRLTNLARTKGVDLSDLINDVLKKDLELIETAT
jgi:hypothetical protein